jgi:ankyrin repeat protein
MKSKNENKDTKQKNKKYLPYLVIVMVILAVGWFSSGSYRQQIDFLLGSPEEKLHYCTVINDQKRAEELLKAGANANYQDVKGWSQLHYAAHEGYVNLIDLLLKHGANINSKTKFGWTPLHWAIYQKRYDAAERLIKRGAKINAGNFLGNTPLHIAAFQEDTKMCDMLLKNGADINHRNKSGSTPLDYMVHQQSYKMTEYLLKHYAAPDSDKKARSFMFKDYILPLSRAAVLGNVRIAALLLKYNAPVNARDRMGNTALHDAVRFNKKQMVIFLLNCNADWRIRNNEGKSAYDLAEKADIQKLIGAEFLKRLQLAQKKTWSGDDKTVFVR